MVSLCRLLSGQEGAVPAEGVLQAPHVQPSKRALLSLEALASWNAV